MKFAKRSERDFAFTQIQSALRDAGVVTVKRDVIGPRTLMAGVTVGLVVVSWVMVYGPFGYGDSWLELPIDVTGLLGPLVVGRVIPERRCPDR